MRTYLKVVSRADETVDVKARHWVAYLVYHLVDEMVGMLVDVKGNRMVDQWVASQVVHLVVVMVASMVARSVAQLAGSLVASKDAMWVVSLDASRVVQSVFGSAVCWVV